MPIKGYKAFDKDMKCRGFQYKEGETYETDKAEICSTGFHFCTDPRDVLNYYSIHDSNFHEVQALEEAKKSNEDTKHVTTKIKIGSKLTLPQFIKTCIDFTLDICKTTITKKDSDENSAKIGSSRDSAQIELNGQDSIGSAIGIDSIAKGKIGNWIVLAEWIYDNEKKRHIPMDVQSVKIDGKKIKEDTFYKISGGKFVEV